MKVGQVWYTSALRGAGGINQFQIVAASGRLGDRSQPLTQEILKSCYRPAHGEVTLTWETQRGARIAAYRLAAPRDAPPVAPGGKPERPGNFFAHVLVGGSEALPDRALAGLWGASGWLTAAPADLPPKLPTLGAIDEIGLATPAPMDRDVALAVTAGFLASVREFRPTALAMPPGHAASYASLLSILLPARYGLISFCSNPEDDQVDRYAVVAGRPSSARFRVIEPEERPDVESAAMARILLDAYDGDALSLEVVRAIEDRSAELVHFADGLRHWVKVVGLATSGTGAPTDAIDFIKGDPRLARALAEGPGRAALADAIAAGVIGTGLLIAAVEPTEAIGPLVDLAIKRVAASDPEHSAAALTSLAADAPRTACDVARGAIRAWAKGDQLDDLSGRARADLLRVIAAQSPHSRHAPAHLISATSADLIASDPSLPAAWRTGAIWQHAEAVQDTTIAAALLDAPGMAADLADHLSDPLTVRIGDALGLLPPDAALQIAHRFASGVPQAELDGWTSDALRRMPADDRIRQIRHLADARAVLPSEWGMLLADALDDAVLAISRGGPVPPFRSLILLFGSVDAPGSALLAWEPFSRAYTALDSGGFSLGGPAQRAAAAATSLVPGVREAALELVYLTIHVRAIDRDAWSGGVSGAWRGLDEPMRAIAWPALVRATLRTVKEARPDSLRYRTVFWIASEMAEEHIAKDALKGPVIQALIDDLTITDRRELDAIVRRPDYPHTGKMIGKLLRAGSSGRFR